MKRKGIKWLSRIAHRVAMKSRTRKEIATTARVRDYRAARSLLRFKREGLRGGDFVQRFAAAFVRTVR